MMSNFQLSKQADPNKIFLTKLSELEGRFDPHFHKLEFKYIEKKINLSGFDTPKLKDLFEINRGGSPRPINQYFTNDENGVNWIKIGDTKKVDKYIYKTKQKIKPEGIKFSREVIEGDFILSNSMSFGRPYIMKITGCIHDGWLLFRPKTNKASKDYLHTILGTNFIYKLFKKQTIGGVVENLNIDLVKNIKIPIPPKNIQAKIVAKMDAAYKNKQDKEQQAQDLLNSIDTYLLGELGIDLPEQIDNSLAARIFTKKISEVTGGRFDPSFCLLDKTSQKCKYSFYKLNSLANVKKGNSITKENIISGNVPVIAGGQTSPYSHYVANYNGDIITVSASGAYAGYVWYHEKPIFASDCSVISSENDDISVKYIAEYLKSQQQYIYNLQQGAAQPHIYPSDLEQLKIPLPPLAKQNQIAEHISKIRDQAKQLQIEAKDELEQAKKEIETMILGGEQ